MGKRITNNNNSQKWRYGLLDEYVNAGVVTLTRGNVISKIDIAKNPGSNPIYSSSIHKNGLFGKYKLFMFDEELITWSVDGGGNFFYRPKHKYSVTNVGGILRINDTNRLTYKYLYYLLDWEHSFLKFDYQSKAHPSVIRKLYKIIEPPILEQVKISEFLSSIDDEINKIFDLIYKTKKLKEGLLSELFTKGIGKKSFKKTEIGTLPKEWDAVLIDSVAKRGSGHTPNKQHPEYWNGGIKWVSLSDSSKLDNRYIYNTDKEISLEGIENSSAVLHSKDTVIICRDAGIGKVGILGEDNMAVSQHFIAWKCSEKLNNQYLYYLLQAWRKKFERIATGTTIKTIGLSFFKELIIPLPNIDEQEKIGEILWMVDEKLRVSSELMEGLVKLKKSLMPDLFTAKVKMK